MYNQQLKIHSSGIKKSWWVGVTIRYGLDGAGIKLRRGGGEILRTRPDRPWGSPSLLYNWSRVSFPGGLESGVYHPPPSSAEVTERVEWFVYSLSGPSRLVLGCNFNRKFMELNITGGTVGAPESMCIWQRMYSVSATDYVKALNHYLSRLTV